VRKFYEYGGILASVVLIAFGIGSLFMGISGRDRVRDDLAREKIVGTPDMEGIANKKIETGSDAEKFAAGIRKHTLEATGGKTYAEMPRFIGKDGKPTNDEKAAAVDPKSGEPQSNPEREIWINSTALSTALNTAYFGESVATFAIVMGIALLLTGIGFLIVSLRLLREPPARTGPGA
jgi:hypothetical protein